LITVSSEVRAGTRDAYTMEKRYIRKDGRVIWGLLAVSATRDQHGALQSIIGMLLDITERKRAELALARAKALAEELAHLRQQQVEEAAAISAVGAALASTLEPAELYQVILEQSARILPCDHAGVTLYAQGQATFFATWGEPRIQPGFQCPMPELWLPEVVGSASYIPDADKEPSWLAIPPLVGPYRARSVLSAPLVIDGTVVGSFWVSSRMPDYYEERHMRLAGVFAAQATQALRNAQHYAAEQTRARTAEDLARLRSDFIASVSHELRTPLTAIIGFGELLQARWHSLSDTHRLQRINDIVVAANRQKQLVDDLLLLSKLDVDSLGTSCDDVLLLTLLQRAAAEVQASYGAQQIMLIGDEGVRIYADPSRTVQVLTNLLDNAAKYSPDGSPVTLAWLVEGDRAVIRVIDQGSGIPEQGRRQLFTRFGRVPGSTMRAGRVGTGLGLYLSRRLAEIMGGDLDLETTGPEGSTFRLRLPLAPPAPAAEGSQALG
jgi:signal transduction histidine kinase